jgi:hypothetical protein
MSGGVGAVRHPNNAIESGSKMIIKAKKQDRDLTEKRGYLLRQDIGDASWTRQGFVIPKPGGS